jgi:hypothetical protein
MLNNFIECSAWDWKYDFLTIKFNVNWAPCHHGMVNHEVMDRGGSPADVEVHIYEYNK